MSIPEPEPLHQLIESLRKLPGVGIRTARRMAYHLLQYDTAGAVSLSQALQAAVDGLCHCEMCNSFSQTTICPTCQDEQRDASTLCVVETPADQNMLESSHGYKGLYYVLQGRLAPLEGVGPDEIHLAGLLQRVADDRLKEVILATNFTPEGETTAYYLAEILGKRGLKVTRLARGVPSGSELEYVDAGTLAWALLERRPTN